MSPRRSPRLAGGQRASPRRQPPSMNNPQNQSTKDVLSQSQKENSGIGVSANTSVSANSSALASDTDASNSTEVRKVQALADFQRMADITPRSAILEYAAAHASSISMDTLSKYFTAPQSQSVVLANGGFKGHAVLEKEDRENVELFHGEDESPSSPCPQRRGRRSRSSGQRVREEEMDPDLDIIRPTDMSGPDTSLYPVSEDSIDNETSKIVKRTRNRRKRRGNRNMIDENAFDISLPVARIVNGVDGGKAAAGQIEPRSTLTNTERDVILNKSTISENVKGNDSTEIESILELKFHSKRRKAGTKPKNLITSDDFAGIELCEESIISRKEAVVLTEHDNIAENHEDYNTENEISEDDEKTFLARARKSMKLGQIIHTSEFEDLSMNISSAEIEGKEITQRVDADESKVETRRQSNLTSKKTIMDEDQSMDVSAETPIVRRKRKLSNRIYAIESKDFTGISLNMNNSNSTASTEASGSVRSGFFPNTASAVGKDGEKGWNTRRESGPPDQPEFPPLSYTTELFAGEEGRSVMDTHSNEVSENWVTIEERNEELSMKSVRRKSVVIGGLPSLPVDKTMIMENTAMFRPNIESTRLGGDGTSLTEFGTASPEAAASQKPGWDASTPVHLASLSIAQVSPKARSIAASVSNGIQSVTPESVHKKRNQTRQSLRPSVGQDRTRLEGLKQEEVNVEKNDVETSIRLEVHNKVANEPNKEDGPNEDIAEPEDLNIDNINEHDMRGQEEGMLGPKAISEENDGDVTKAIPILVTKNAPTNAERKQLRQVTIARYLGTANFTESLGLSRLLSAEDGKKNERKVSKTSKKKISRKKKETTLVFPLRNVKFEYQRFSRFKVKKEAESILAEASAAFVNLVLSEEVSHIAAQRGSSKIELCDQRRFLGEWGPFNIPTVEDDLANKNFFPFVRNLVREELAAKLIPCHVGRGIVDPPADIWNENREKQTKPTVRTLSSMIKRFKTTPVEKEKPKAATKRKRERIENLI